MSDSFSVSITLGFVKTVVCLYDLTTYPLYFLFQKPWKKTKLYNQIRAKQVNCDDPYSEWKRIEVPPHYPIFEELTIDKLFKKCVEYYSNNRCLGYREVIGEEDEVQPDEKSFRKVIQTDFKWFTYLEIDAKIEDVAKGFLLNGIKPGDTVMIFAETRLEWFLSAQAVFRLGASIATLYATLALDAIAHGINETEVTHLITTQDLLPKLKKILNQLPNLKCIIYIEGFKKASVKDFESIKMLSISQIEQEGSMTKQDVKFEQRNHDDTAIIMYTSGSTGVPKGVVITHRNVLATIKGLYGVAHSLSPDHTYMAYLPLAHVLELAAESFFCAMGIAIGYSSPHTMTDKSTAIKRGSKGDASVLRPTIMVSVPLVLDRVKKSVQEHVESKGALFQGIFKFAMEYKEFWTKRGFRTPVVNHFICNKIKSLLGGKLQYMVSGSAPLAPDTHAFIRSCMDVTLISGYGLTETASGATIMDFDDISVGRIGTPLYGLSIKLSDWEEGNYHVTDSPYPRGEIVVGGDCITSGYYKNEALTQEFYKEENGKRWFYTGDIGEIHPDGSIKLIDRKKDLVKLQYGEYISLGKIETELKTCQIVDNICVYGDSFHTYIVALIVPNQKNLNQIAHNLNKDHLTHEEKCKDPLIIEFVKKILLERAIKLSFGKTEIPAKIMLVTEEWTPDSGLVTAALKIRRKYIQDRYLKEINAMYNIDGNCVQST